MKLYLTPDQVKQLDAVGLIIRESTRNAYFRIDVGMLISALPTRIVTVNERKKRTYTLDMYYIDKHWVVEYDHFDDMLYLESAPELIDALFAMVMKIRTDESQ